LGFGIGGDEVNGSKCDEVNGLFGCFDIGRGNEKGFGGFIEGGKNSLEVR